MWVYVLEPTVKKDSKFRVIRLSGCEQSLHKCHFYYHKIQKRSIAEKLCCSPGGNLQPAWYCSSTAEGSSVLAWYWHKHGLPSAWLRKVTWLEVIHRYWRGTGHRYHASTDICTGSVLALLRSRLLADTWTPDWGCTMPVPRHPFARYQLSSTGIAPCLQLARYCAVSKYWHECDFSTWGDEHYNISEKYRVYKNFIECKRTFQILSKM